MPRSFPMTITEAFAGAIQSSEKKMCCLRQSHCDGCHRSRQNFRPNDQDGPG
jgi:hypothetical protein